MYIFQIMGSLVEVHVTAIGGSTVKVWIRDRLGFW